MENQFTKTISSSSNDDDDDGACLVVVQVFLPLTAVFFFMAVGIIERINLSMAFPTLPWASATGTRLP